MEKIQRKNSKQGQIQNKPTQRLYRNMKQITPKDQELDIGGHSEIDNTNIWDQAAETNIIKLKKIQNNAMKRISRAPLYIRNAIGRKQQDKKPDRQNLKTHKLSNKKSHGLR